MNKICPYLAAAMVPDLVFKAQSTFSEERVLSLMNCRKEGCEMWSTTMKACTLRGFFDDKDKNDPNKELDKIASCFVPFTSTVTRPVERN